MKNTRETLKIINDDEKCPSCGYYKLYPCCGYRDVGRTKEGIPIREIWEYQCENCGAKFMSKETNN